MRIFVPAGLALGLMCLPGIALAQRFEGAVKGGFSFADVPEFANAIKEDGGNPTVRFGAVAGGHIAFALGGIVALQAEALYTQKGFKASAPSGLDQNVAFTIDYIDVPVLLRLGPAGGNGLQLLAGPSFNFNTAARVVLEGTFDSEEDIKDEVEDVEIGLVVGAGYYGPMLIVEGRYVQGLTDISNFPEFGEKETYRNRSFQVMVGIRFGR